MNKNEHENNYLNMFHVIY